MTTISHRETMIVKKKLEVQKINFVNTTLTNVIQKTLKFTLMRPRRNTEKNYIIRAKCIENYIMALCL